MFLLKVDDLVKMLENLLQFVLVAHLRDLVIIQMLQDLGVIVQQELEAITRQEVHQLGAVIIHEEVVRLLTEVLEVEVHPQKVFQKEAVNI